MRRGQAEPGQDKRAGNVGPGGVDLRIGNKILHVFQPCGLPGTAVTLIPRTTKVGAGE